MGYLRLLINSFDVIQVVFINQQNSQFIFPPDLSARFMIQEKLETTLLFPKSDIFGKKIASIGELRKLLQRQQVKSELSKCFRISYEEGTKSYYCCKLKAFCKARIVVNYCSLEGFTIIEVQNKHNHEINNSLIQLQNHHICKETIKSFECSIPKMCIPSGRLTLKINSGSKGNPGPSIFGYILTDEKKNVLIQRKKKFESLTNNQIECLALIWGLLDCLVHQVQALRVETKNKILVGWVKNENKVSSPNIIGYIETLKMIQAKMKNVKIEYEHMPKNQMQRRILELIQRY